MTFSTRYCIQNPVTGWQRLSQADFDRYAYKNAAMPEFAGRAINVAVAQVELDGQKIIQIERVRRVVWQFREDGRIDQHQRAKAIARKMNGEAVEEPTAFSERDMTAFRREFRMK